MAELLPQPPVPINADLRHFPNMPLEVGRLRDSRIVKGDAEVFRCALLLWCGSWHQVPAGSLPDDDLELSHLVGLGRDLKTWRKIKGAAMQGWRMFADRRFYHLVVCEKVIEGLNSTQHHDWLKACARVRKENHQRTKKKLDKLPPPERPKPLVLEWPQELVPEREPGNTVRVPEHEFRAERKGRDILPRGAQEAHPLGTVPETSPPPAARGSLEGSAHDTVHALIDSATKLVRVK